MSQQLLPGEINCIYSQIATLTDSLAKMYLFAAWETGYKCFTAF